jgi:hypothetical protein
VCIRGQDNANMHFLMAMQTHLKKVYNFSHSNNINGRSEKSVGDTILALVCGHDTFPTSTHVTSIYDH